MSSSTMASPCVGAMEISASEMLPMMAVIVGLETSRHSVLFPTHRNLSLNSLTPSAPGLITACQRNQYGLTMSTDFKAMIFRWVPGTCNTRSSSISSVKTSAQRTRKASNIPSVRDLHETSLQRLERHRPMSLCWSRHKQRESSSYLHMSTACHLPAWAYFSS